MNNSQNKVKKMIATIVKFSRGKGNQYLSDKIAQYLYDHKSFRNLIADLLSVDDFNETNIDQFLQIVRSNASKWKEINEMQIELGPESAFTAKRVYALYIQIIVSIHTILSILNQSINSMPQILSSDGNYLEQYITSFISHLPIERLKTGILMPLRYPGTLKVISDILNEYMISFIPSDYKETMENILIQDGISASIEDLTKQIPIWTQSGTWPEENTRKMGVMNLLLNKLIVNEDFLRLATNNLSQIPEIFNKQKLDEFAASVLNQQTSALESFIDTYIDASQQSLEPPSVENWVGDFFRLVEARERNQAPETSVTDREQSSANSEYRR